MSKKNKKKKKNEEKSKFYFNRAQAEELREQEITSANILLNDLHGF